MKFKILCTIFCLLTVACFDYATAFGGSDGAGGGDFRADLGIAWFMKWTPMDMSGKKRIVNFCIQSDNNFGVSDTTLAAQVARAFEEWGQYSKNAGSDFFATETQFDVPCGKDESLTIYAGVQNSEISQERTHYAASTASLNVRSHFDYARAWGKGYIWIDSPLHYAAIAPQSSEAQRIVYALILHEVGHIFGNAHFDNTIMTSQISDLVRAAKDATDLRFTSIDWNVELATPLPEGVRHYSGYVAQINAAPSFLVKRGQPDPTQSAKVFQFLEGQSALGNITASFDLNMDILVRNVVSGTLTLTDDKGPHTHAIQFNNWPCSSISSDPTIFRYLVARDSAMGILYQMNMVRGTLTLASGRTVPITLYRNFYQPWNAAYAMTYVDPSDATEKTFFTTPTLGEQ